MTELGPAIAVGLVGLLAGTTRVAPDAVVTSRVAPPLECGAVIAATGVACLLTASMYITENGSQAATIAAAPRLSTRRYNEDRRGRALAVDLEVVGGLAGPCSVICDRFSFEGEWVRLRRGDGRRATVADRRHGRRIAVRQRTGHRHRAEKQRRRQGRDRGACFVGHSETSLSVVVRHRGADRGGGRPTGCPPRAGVITFRACRASCRRFSHRVSGSAPYRRGASRPRREIGRPVTGSPLGDVASWRPLRPEPPLGKARRSSRRWRVCVVTCRPPSLEVGASAEWSASGLMPISVDPSDKRAVSRSTEAPYRLTYLAHEVRQRCESW